MAIVKKREVLKQSAAFKLSLVQHHKKKWYEIVYYRWGSAAIHDSTVEREVRDFFSPERDKSLDYMGRDHKWKFKSRDEAMKKYTWANLRWQ